MIIIMMIIMIIIMIMQLIRLMINTVMFIVTIIFMRTTYCQRGEIQCMFWELQVFISESIES